MAVGELERGSRGKEVLGWDDGTFGVELWLLVAENFFPAHAVDDLFVASYFDLDFDPLVGREGGCGGLHNVLGNEFSVHFEIGAGGANIAGGALAFAFVSQELELKADGEALVESHALRRL